ncbi:hypothetical protein [Embleya sp. NPDC020630]|uniref:hypothetical protein n=1 Tax=Embleya sp. NPDC020630 TaxID=3363979 RepID=UPI00378EE2EE
MTDVTGATIRLMDEPFGAVDPITRGHLQDELIRIQYQLHKTIVFVTHDFDEAVKLGDRIVVLREQSHIAQYDTPEAILTNPADEFAAGFVGAGAALKRLTLSLVRDVEVVPFATAGLRDDIATIRRSAREYGTDGVLLLDERRWPTRWLRREEVRRGGPGSAVTAHEVGDTVTRDATLRDALDAILTEGGGKVAVTGARGEYVGVVSIETLMTSIQEMLEADQEAAREHLEELETQREVQRFEDERRTGHEDGAHPAESDPR